MKLILSPVAVAAFISMLFNSVNCDGFYTIAAPEYIRPHTDYKVAVTLHNAVEPVSLRLAIEDGLSYKIEKLVDINTSRTELVELHIDDLDIRNGYKFVAEGLSGLKFKNESTLRVESKDVSIFIQTDKGVYKPGETIRFRVIVLDSQLKPVVLTPDNLLSIYLNDPEKNRIKQWLQVNLKKGVFTGEIELSELPVLGGWTFQARIGQEKKTKTIDVVEYILPNFDVTIDSPNEFSVKDSKIRAIIRSKYTYGKLVKGEAIVTLTPKEEHHWYQYKKKPVQKVQKKVPINGKGTVEFDSEKDISLDGNHVRSFDIQATVVEDLTGRNESTSKTIRVHDSRYKITSSDDSSDFKPGNELKFSISVTQHDNSPVLLNENTKSIKIVKIFNKYTPHEKAEDYNFELNNKGMANIIIPTASNETDFNLQVNYMDEQTDLGYYHKQWISEPADLAVKILTTPPILNRMIEVEVKSKDILQNFTYQVIAHGKIVYAKNIATQSGLRHTFQIKATFDLVPKATIIVYRFKDDQIIAAKAEIVIDNELINFVKLTLSQFETQPGKDIDIGIDSNRDSFVGLLGIDQSVLLLKNDEELTKQKAFQEMEKYQQQSYGTASGPWTTKPHEFINDYFKIFEQCKVIFFTNAEKDVARYPDFADRFVGGWPWPSYQRGMPIVHFSTPTGLPGLAGLPGPSYQKEMVMFSTTQPPAKSLEAVEPPRVRTEFPETWLWEDFDLNNGSISITRKVPDTITSWVLTAFSVNPQTGLGLTKTPKSLKVFQPFFIALNLPYSVKRGEVVAVPVVLFNYLSTSVNADLVLHNENNEFEFIDGAQDDQTSRKRQVTVASDAGISETFLIRFNSIGKISLKVTASSALAGDAAVRVLQVDPEGVPQYINKAVFVDLRETNAYDFVQTVDVPSNAVPGSLKINVNAIGNFFGGTVENLHQLVRLPTGCGEQNMLKFVPNIVILDYLTAVDELNESIKNKAIKYSISGYQRELTYRHGDGSFSAFGKYDSKGSTWLTAFVVKSFKQAEKYIDIDGKVIDEALQWLSSVQAADGSFPETGYIIDHKMQGGSSKGIALTAYTTIAFLVNKRSEDWAYDETISKALQNIFLNINDIDDVYTLAVAAYALQLAHHSAKDRVLDKLVARAASTDRQKWWSKSGNMTSEASKSIDVEITAYGVLALVQANRASEIFPYFKWLLAQRNDRGGFVGTQDTVVGLEALATYGRYFSSKNIDLQLQIKSNTTADQFINVNSENSLLLQTVDLPTDTKSVSVSAVGHGFALFQLSYRYNLNGNDSRSTFTLTPEVRETTAGRLNVVVCARYNPTKEDELQSNMVIVEVGMPSGFLIDKENLNELLKQPNIKLVESKRGETVTDIYLDQMQQDQGICIEVQAYQSHKVAENKPVPVRIYDYYDSSRNAREFYEIAPVNACDICDGEECLKSCSPQ